MRAWSAPDRPAPPGPEWAYSLSPVERADSSAPPKGSGCSPRQGARLPVTVPPPATLLPPSRSPVSGSPGSSFHFLESGQLLGAMQVADERSLPPTPRSPSPTYAPLRTPHHMWLLLPAPVSRRLSPRWCQVLAATLTKETAQRASTQERAGEPRRAVRLRC